MYILSEECVGIIHVITLSLLNGQLGYFHILCNLVYTDDIYISVMGCS